MTGKQIIDAIQKHHLEDFDIIYINDNDLGSRMTIEFDNNDIELPYPEYKDTHFNNIAHIYRYKILEIDNEGNSKCHNKELDTSKPYQL